MNGNYDLSRLEEILLNNDPDGYEEYKNLLKRGIKLTAMQMNLMFLNRAYGKTFMSYCALMIGAKNKEEFTIDFDSENKISNEDNLTSHCLDPDLKKHNKMENKLHYLDGLCEFVCEYYPEYTIYRKTKLKARFSKKEYI